MNTTSPTSSRAVDRTDPAALLASLEEELDAIDLSKRLPDAVVTATAIAESNGDGIEPDPLVTKLMVLTDRGTLTSEEGMAIMKHLYAR